jgi:hypothetical protein
VFSTIWIFQPWTTNLFSGLFGALVGGLFTLRHFQDSHFGGSRLRVDDYITYEAFGLAILLAKSSAEADEFLPPFYRGRGPTRSVVLIDEVDKAPRDLLNEY